MFYSYPSAPRVVKFVTSLISVVSEEGKEAVFKCTVSPSDAVVTWLRNGVKIEASKKYVISHKDTNHSLTITDLTLEDAAEISANAEGVKSTANLRVRGKRWSCPSHWCYNPSFHVDFLLIMLVGKFCFYIMK